MCKRLNSTRKRARKIPIARNSERTKAKRKEYAFEFIRLMMQGYRFNYIDETGFNDKVN